MKRLLTFLFISALFLAGEPFVSASPSYAEEGKKVVAEEKSTVGSILDKIWTKIRTLSPRKKARSAGSAVAGVKGAEKGSEELSPYWKGDQKRDLKKEIEKFSVAEDLMEEEKYSEAIIALESFREEFPMSRFMPNAVFSKGLCLLKLDRKDDAVNELRKFLETYPKHDLATDATQLVTVLGTESGE